MIKFFNTLGHKETELKPLKDKAISMYVCGPTVYDFDHLGHARIFIVFDFLRRFLTSRGYKVNFIQNITDVGHLTGDADQGEDKIEKKARAQKKDPQEIARFFEEEHFKDMAALNVLPPDQAPRATENIPEIIEFIKELIEKKHAYVVGGNVYFDIKSFPDYGKLSGRKIEELMAGARVEPNPEKKNQADFALWKKAEPEHLMQWDSPWGRGYPGWHIECSAMTRKLLGDTFDIHGGAVELVFPHHENEIAQTESLTGRPMANLWLHAGLVTVRGEKMSKSLGNFVTIKDLLKKYDSDTIRLWVLKTHWRRPMDWEENAFQEAEILAKKLARARLNAPKEETPYKNQIIKALSDDFNTPQALSIIFENLTKMSQNDFAFLEQVFGLKMIVSMKLTPEQEKLVKEREEARRAGNFSQADKLRIKLKSQGIILEDTPEGTKISQ